MGQEISTLSDRSVKSPPRSGSNGSRTMDSKKRSSSPASPSSRSNFTDDSARNKKDSDDKVGDEDVVREGLPEQDTVIKTAGVSIDKNSVEKHAQLAVQQNSTGKIITYGKRTDTSSKASSSSYKASVKNRCWKLSIPHSTFVQTVPDKDKKILRAVDVDIHFPVFNKFVAVKSFRLRGSVTPSKMLAVVQRMAVTSMAFYIKHKHREATGENLDRDITYKEVQPLLEKHVTCSLMVSPKKPGYHVYVL